MRPSSPTVRAVAIAVALLIPAALQAQVTDALQAKIQARYGRTRLAQHQMPTFSRLDLFLTDARHHAPGVVASDTALAAARLAAKNLPASYRPDSIRVAITTVDIKGRSDTTRSWMTIGTWATAKLQK